MRLTSAELAQEAAATGFQTEPLERVILLLELLEAIRIHPFLKDRVALKGGTALNVFKFNVPRLSVDIDLNYIGAVDPEGMLADRPKIEQALQAVCGRVGVQPRRVPSDHAGGKWRLSFNRVTGGTGTLELDMNFMLRMPLWPVELVDSRPVGTFVAKGIPVVDIHELPLLRGRDAPDRNDLPAWTKALAADCHKVLSMVLPLADNEREFIERLNDKGEIASEVLTADERLRRIVATHPGLLWKAQNVRSYRDLNESRAAESDS